MSLQSKPKKHRTKKRVEFNVPEKEIPVSHKETSKKEKFDLEKWDKVQKAEDKVQKAEYKKWDKEQKAEYKKWDKEQKADQEKLDAVNPTLHPPAFVVDINYPKCDIDTRAKCDSAFIIQHIVLVLIQMILCGAMLWLVTTIQNYPNWEQNSDAKRLYMMLLALIVVTLLTLGMAFWLKSAIVGFTFIVSVFLSIYVFMLFDDVKLTELKSDTQVQLTETPAFKWNRGIVLSQAVLSVLCIVSYVIYGRKIGEI